MSPEDHYAAAERLLRLVDEAGDDWKLIWSGLVLQQAQVHATLAAAPHSAVPA